MIQLASVASDPSTQDPLDLAILAAARGHPALEAERLALVPFDPATKRAEATFERDGTEWRAIKGAHAVVSALVGTNDALAPAAVELGAQGCRVLAVAAGPSGALRLVGLVGLLDPPRDDSRAVIERLNALGVRVVMVTGDAGPTARSIARQVGLGDRIAGSPDADPATYDVLAGALPEHKLQLIASLERTGHVVAMTGDGVNDAPALEQADVGVAVSTAVDVAKSAAALVLTQAGLSGVLAAVESGRRIFQRMLTYTLNMSVKKLQIPVFLAIGFVVLHRVVVSPRLLLLLVLTNDLSTMALARDRAHPSLRPEKWNGRALVAGAFVVAIPWLAFLVTTLVAAERLAALSAAQAQTVAFLSLAVTGQANVYLVRERRHLWRSRPGRSVIAASVLTTSLVSTLALTGLFMAPIGPLVVLGILGSVVVFTLGLDLVKAFVFARV